MNELTGLQRRVFHFVRDKLVAGRPAPTAREVAAQFGWSSKRAAECHLEAIIRKGWLASEPGKARSLRLKDVAQAVRRVVVEIPLFGSIPAGFSADREQEADGCVPVTIDSIGFKPTRNTFALRVSGDSMIGKHICDGDIVVLEHGSDRALGKSSRRLLTARAR